MCCLTKTFEITLVFVDISRSDSCYYLDLNLSTVVQLSTVLDNFYVMQFKKNHLHAISIFLIKNDFQEISRKLLPQIVYEQREPLAAVDTIL